MHTLVRAVVDAFHAWKLHLASKSNRISTWVNLLSFQFRFLNSLAFSSMSSIAHSLNCCKYISIRKYLVFSKILQSDEQWVEILSEGTFLSSSKVCPIENNTNLNSFFCWIKSSIIDFIFLPAFYLIMWLMTSPKNSEKIAILKKWRLVFFWGVKT